jgi:hypothetical protein
LSDVTVVALVLLASYRQAAVSGRRPLWMAAVVTTVGSLVWALPLASHVQDYYVYLASPAAALLLALGFGGCDRGGLSRGPSWSRQPLCSPSAPMPCWFGRTR